MVFAYDLLVTAFIAICLSFLVAKLVSLALSSGEVGDGRGICAAVDNGDRQNKGPVGDSEKRLRVEGLKSKKKKVKKISAETVLVSEFKGKTEPPVDAENFGGLIKADDLVDDCEKLGSVDRVVEFPVKNEGVISSYVNPLNQRVVEEIGFSDEVSCPIEGLGQEDNTRNDLKKMIAHREEDRGDHGVGVVKERIESKEGDKIEDQDEHQRVLGLESEEKVDVQKEDVISGNEEGEMEISDGEEWEGIERNELVSDFAKAVSFVECVEKGGLDKLGSDVIMQFYGLQKVAMEGPCHEPQSTALKLSARAMWNAWQNFGSMNPEEAMEKYVTLLSDKFPGWMDGHPSLQGKMNSEEDEACSSFEVKLNTPPTLTLTCTNESKPGAEPVTSTSDIAGSPSSVNKDEE